jgi:hypothetical protein
MSVVSSGISFVEVASGFIMGVIASRLVHRLGVAFLATLPLVFLQVTGGAQLSECVAKNLALMRLFTTDFFSSIGR